MTPSSAGLPDRSYASEDSDAQPIHAAPELYSARILMGDNANNGAPTLVQATPGDNSSQVAAGSNIVLTFSTAMAAGTGSIIISDGYLQSYIDKAGHTQTRWVGVTDSHVVSVTDSQVSIDGNTVTIDLSNDLQPGISYNVTMAAGVLTDSANRPYAGLLDSSKLHFTTDIATVAQISGALHFNDSGVSSTDYITNVAMQTVHGTYSGTLGAGEHVQVSLDNGDTWHVAGSAANGQWSCSGFDPLSSSGSGTMLARVVDSSNNPRTTVSQAYVFDNNPPHIVGATSSDSNLGVGESATVTITFSEAVNVQNISTTANSSTYSNFLSTDGGLTWSATVTPNALTSASNIDDILHVTATDLAGNALDNADGADYIHVPHYNVSTVTLSSDTGSSANDFYTSAVHQTISGNYDTLPANGHVKVSIDGGTTFVDATVNTANHTWSLATDLQGGTQQLMVQVTDASTQVIASFMHSYTLDTQAASQSLASVTPTLDTADDSGGASNSDNITNVTQPHVSVHIADAYQLNSGDVVQIVDSNHGNAIVGSYALLDTDLLAYGGNFSIKLDQALSDGEHDLKVQIGDLAGNAPGAASNTALAVTIDTHAPTLTGTSPAADAHGVYTNTSIVLTFDEAIDLRSSTAFTLTNGTDSQYLGMEGGQVSVDGNKIVLSLNQPLNTGSNYHLYMDGGEITDLAGNAAYSGNDHLLDFTTTDDGDLQQTPHIVASATNVFSNGSTAFGGQFYSASGTDKVQLLDGNTWVDAQASSQGNSLFSWSANSSTPSSVAEVRMVDAAGAPLQYQDYGNSVLYFGSSGNNTIAPTDNKSIVFSGDGDDSVTVGNSAHVVTGNGNDTISAGNSTSLIAGNGNDSITVGNSASVVTGNGNNTITVGNSASVVTGSGNNTVNAGNNANINSQGYDLLHVGSNATVALHGSGSTVDASGNGLTLTSDNGSHSIILNSLNVNSIAMGSGNDTLNLSFNGSSFDLGSLSGTHHMSGIDIVNITGSGNDISIGALTDVTALSGTQTLVITGNASNFIHIDNNVWTDTLSTSNSNTYEKFQGTADHSITLLVLIGILQHSA